MRRKRAAGSAVVVACLMVLLATTAWAAPPKAEPEPLRSWTGWSAELLAMLQESWERGMTAVAGLSTAAGSGRETPGGVATQDGETCVDPGGTKHSCSIDPDG